MPVVIAFISQKGGVGKSTLARALAVAAASAGPNVSLADLDVQQRTLVLWAKTRKANQLAPAIAVRAFADAEEAIASAKPGDLMILDTPGRVSDATLSLVQRTHLVVQPTGPSLDDLRPAVLLFHALGNLQIPRARLAFALCRTMTKREEDAARAYLEAAGYAVLPGAMPERVAYREALDRGQSPAETNEGDLNKRAHVLMQALLMKIETSTGVLLRPPPGLRSA